MITYHHLYGLVIFNLIALIVLFLLCKLSKKAAGYGDLLAAGCWLVFSWYYQLNFSDHLSAAIHREHPFLELFVTIIYGFGCWISIILTFSLAVVAVGQILHPEAGSEKRIESGNPNNSPWPLWIAGLLIGLFSAYMLKTSLLPGLNKLMDFLTKLIYADLFHMSARFPDCYLPAAGIAAGTVTAACLTHYYRRSRAPFLYFPGLVLVPVLTAVLAPLTDLAGTILVIVLAFSAYLDKDQWYGSRQRGCIPFVLPALGIGCLSGLYYYLVAPAAAYNSKGLFIAGGVVSGFTIACLGFKSYMCENNRFRALYFLAFIPYCSPAFGSFIEYIISLITAFVFMVIGLGTIHMGRGSGTTLSTEVDDPVYYMGNGTIQFTENGQTVYAEESHLYLDIYNGKNGRKYERRGGRLYRI